MTMLEIIYAFGVLFITCELGQRLNQAFEDCNDIINQFKWYSFPVEIQKMLPIIMNFAQQQVVFYCFGSTACIRETFKSVSIQSIRYHFQCSYLQTILKFGLYF